MLSYPTPIFILAYRFCKGKPTLIYPTVLSVITITLNQIITDVKGV